MQDIKFLKQLIVNKKDVKKLLIVIEIIEEIEQFLKVSNEIKTVINFEEKVSNFMGRGFPYKKDLPTLLFILSQDNMKFFEENVDSFRSIIKGYLDEEIRLVYKNLSKAEILEKYESLFYQFEILKNSIFNAIANFNNRKKDDEDFLEQIVISARENLNKTIYDVINPPNWNKILEDVLKEDSNEVIIL